MTSEAFAKAVTEMTQTLYRIACSQLSVAADREDAVQEALLRAWEKRASLKNDEWLRTWVIRILLNVCHDIRREKRRMTPAESIPDSAAPPSGNFPRLLECLIRLDERERIPVLLYYIEGYDVKLVAAILRIPQGTVKSRLNRGRKHLKDLCREEVFEP